PEELVAALVEVPVELAAVSELADDADSSWAAGAVSDVPGPYSSGKGAEWCASNHQPSARPSIMTPPPAAATERPRRRLNVVVASVAIGSQVKIRLCGWLGNWQRSCGGPAGQLE